MNEIKEKIKEKLNEIDDHHSYAFLVMKEAHIEINGDFSDNAAYHFILSLMDKRPNIKDRVRKYQKWR